MGSRGKIMAKLNWEQTNKVKIVKTRGYEKIPSENIFSTLSQLDVEEDEFGKPIEPTDLIRKVLSPPYSKPKNLSEAERRKIQNMEKKIDKLIEEIRKTSSRDKKSHYEYLKRLRILRKAIDDIDNKWNIRPLGSSLENAIIKMYLAIPSGPSTKRHRRVGK